jgi:hypothetical protein
MREMNNSRMVTPESVGQDEPPKQGGRNSLLAYLLAQLSVWSVVILLSLIFLAVIIIWAV